MRNVAAALRRLVSAHAGLVYDLTDQGTRGHIGHTLTPAGTEWTEFPGYEHIPGLRRYAVQADRAPDPWANEAVTTRRLYRGDPEALSLFRERILGPGGMHYQLRVVLYDDAGRFQGLCGVFRTRRDGDFSAEEEARLQRVTPLLREAFLAVRAVGTEQLSGTALAIVLDAFDEPAYLVSPLGHVVHRNRAAARHGRAPSWIHACLRSTFEGAPFALGHAHRLDLEGREVWLVISRTVGRPRQGLDLAVLPPALRPVAELLALGLSDKEIAAALDRPLPSVRSYVQRTFAKLGVQSRQELMRARSTAAPEPSGEPPDAVNRT